MHPKQGGEYDPDSLLTFNDDENNLEGAFEGPGTQEKLTDTDYFKDFADDFDEEEMWPPQ